MLLATCHDRSSGWTKVEKLDELSDLRQESGNLLWAETNVATLSDQDIALISEEFELPRLAVEDAVEARSRPKMEPFGELLFLVMHQLDEVSSQLEAVQISGFVGPQFVLVFHAGAERTLEEAKARWKDLDKTEDHPSWLLHTLIDVIVDDYQAIADRLEDRMETLEELVLEDPQAEVSRQLYGMKQQLSRLRRYVGPGSRLLERALDPGTPHQPFSQDTALMFRDIRDHLLRINDQIRNIDDLAQAVIDLTRAEQAAVLNENSRRLSAWAAIFGAATVIAGVYGMNFRLYPKDGTSFGFWFAMALIVASTVGLYMYFKRRKWL